MDWFIYDNGLRHERVNVLITLKLIRIFLRRPFQETHVIVLVRVHTCEEKIRRRINRTREVK